jgi:hypothetical protein
MSRRNVCLFSSFFFLLFLLRRAQQAPSTAEALHRPYDQLLDMRARRPRLHGAVRSDARGWTVTLQHSAQSSATSRLKREQQMAFWINAYNAFVLQGRQRLSATRLASQHSRFYDGSRTRRRPSVTLDQIENKILPSFVIARVLALGRGAMGGRLKSEAYTGERLEEQLRGQTAEFLQQAHVKIDQLTGSSPSRRSSAGTKRTSRRRTRTNSARSSASESHRAGRAGLDRSVLLPGERAWLEHAVQGHIQDVDWTLNELK